MKNPFTPTFGIVPPFLAGRDQILADMSKAFQNGLGDPNLCTILIGPRGSGKTAMLSCIGDEARQQGWIVADTVTGIGMLEEIYQLALSSSAEVLGKKEKKDLTGFTIGSFLGLTWAKEETTPLNWRSKMSELMKQLNERDIGLLITVDEVRGDVDDMIRLASVYQLLIREGAKISLVMAGLPVHVGDLITNKEVSFLRRARQQYLDRIPDRDIRSAFSKTIAAGGKSIEREALDRSVQAADGFAYMMQLVGYSVWDVSAESEWIVDGDAELGIRYAKEDFVRGVLNSTYRELSKGDKRFLLAMLEDKDGSVLTDIAKRIGKTPGYASTYKKRLLQAGVIEEQPGNRLVYALPMFREYLEMNRE